MVCQCGRVILDKELQLLWVWQPRPPGERLPVGNGENCQEGRFKLERGGSKEGKQVLSEIGGYARGHLGQCSPSMKMSWKAPFLNPDPLMHWSGPENIAQVKINDEDNDSGIH